MENPIAELRHNEQLTQQELADLAQVTRQVITKVEAGLYNSIPKSLLPVIMDLDPIDYGSYARRYTEWQIAALPKAVFEKDLNGITLNITGPGHYLVVPDLDAADSNIATFIDWRRSINESQLGFCKLMKIQESIVDQYEKGHTQSMPAFLWERLRQVGLSQSYIARVASLPANSTIAGYINGH